LQHWKESVATWLHGVAVRVAGTARRAAQRRRLHEQQVVEKKSSNPLADVSVLEMYGMLDEEVARLPEKYRTPLIQCELMGQRQEEVAHEMGCTVAAIKERSSDNFPF
jgi:DNA-directed RNA polymerase specialized sigma24 family protein